MRKEQALNWSPKSKKTPKGYGIGHVTIQNWLGELVPKNEQVDRNVSHARVFGRREHLRSAQAAQVSAPNLPDLLLAKTLSFPFYIIGAMGALLKNCKSIICPQRRKFLITILRKVKLLLTIPTYLRLNPVMPCREGPLVAY